MLAALQLLKLSPPYCQSDSGRLLALRQEDQMMPQVPETLSFLDILAMKHKN